jgi:hypothetical protein
MITIVLLFLLFTIGSIRFIITGKVWTVSAYKLQERVECLLCIDLIIESICLIWIML